MKIALIGLLDILWDEDFKAKTQLVRGFDIKDQDLQCFVSPVINMLLERKAINNFIKEECIPSIQNQLNNLPSNGRILLITKGKIRDAFPSLDWLTPYQVYIKLYLEELYHIKGFINASGELEAFISTEEAENILANMAD